MSRAKPRDKGSGSFYHDLKADLWRAELTIGRTPEGKPLRWRHWFKTQREAKAALAIKVAEHQQDQIVVTSTSSVAEYLTDWLKQVVVHKSARTQEEYGRIVNKHVIPALGNKALGKLSTRDIQAFYTGKLETYAPWTVLSMHTCLHSALETAVKWDLIRRNPADDVTLPKAPRSSGVTLSPEQARRLIIALEDDPREAYWLMALTTGMRPGELRALKWSDIDTANNVVNLQRAVGRVKGKGWIEHNTKTGGGRPVALGALAVEALRKHRVRQAEARLRAGSRWTDNDLVFANKRGEHLEPQNLRLRSWKPLLERAGIFYVRPYDLRHTSASLLLSLTVHPKVVSERLGHASTEMTLEVYSHVAPTLQREAARRLDDLLQQSS